MSLVDVNGLTISYADGAAVSDLSFSVAAAECVGIVGESGAGKSQTALAIMGLLPANAEVSGSIRLAGTEIIGASPETLRKLRAHKVSMIFQDPAAALNPYVRIGDQIRRILLEHRLANRRNAKPRCIEMLERVGLPDPQRQYRAYPHELSGGMRQRALIAAAMIGEPELIVADEATTALDVTTQSQILVLLRELRQEFKTALLIITHDLGVVAVCCQRVLVMDGGRLVEEGECREVLARPKHDHTARLVAAASRIDADAPPPRVSSESNEAVLIVEQLSVSFEGRFSGAHREFVAVDKLKLSAEAGETIAIVGESGSGKTTVARAIAGLVPAKGGSIRFEGRLLPQRVEKRPRALRRRLQMVFQDPVSSLNPAMRVGRVIAEPLTVHSPEMNAKEIRVAVAKLMARTGLDDDLSERFPHELSGGQAQRVAIARALIVDPVVLICDEALAALDGTVRREITALLKEEQRRSQLCLIMITHDLGVVREICDRVYVMYKGEICESAANEDIFSNPLHDYTKALLAAVPAVF